MIYFVQAVGGLGPIKIGFTRGDNMVTRLQALQAGSPVRLVVIATMRAKRCADERRVHELFAEHRLWSEWFAPHSDLLAYVAKARARTPPHLIDYEYPQRPPKRGNWNPTSRRPRAA